MTDQRLPRQLPDELYLPILAFLRNPVPAARSGEPRCNLRQPDLCSAARVNKFFAAACRPLLYTHIATDRFHELLPSSESEISSKRHLLAYTKTLALEYRSKQEQPSYEYLHREEGGWKLIEVRQDVMDSVAMSMCAYEVGELSKALGLVNRSTSSRKLFPNLETIAVGSIYGGQDTIWRRYYEWTKAPRQPRPPHPSQASTLFADFCRQSSILHFCGRAQFGPFNTPRTSFAGEGVIDDGRQYEWTTHFTADQVMLPVPYNRGGVYWISDAPSTTHWRDIVDSANINFDTAAEMREKGLVAGEATDWTESPCTARCHSNMRPPGTPYSSEKSTPPILQTQSPTPKPETVGG